MLFVGFVVLCAWLVAISIYILDAKNQKKRRNS